MKNFGIAIPCFLLVLIVAGCGGGGSGTSSIGTISTRTAVCGDGLLEVDAGEVCDDGNIITEVCEYGDRSCERCSSDCRYRIPKTYCSDGFIDTANGEMCEDGNTTDNDGCSSECKLGFSKTFGGSHNEIARSIAQTNEGGYIVAGVADSDGNRNYVLNVIKLDSYGETEWDNTYGITSYSATISIRPNSFGEYFVTNGYGTSVLKLDSTGAVLWDKEYGGYTYIESIYVFPTGPFILTGYEYTWRVDYDFDCVLIFVAGDGTEIWSKQYGGDKREECHSGLPTSDGGYILAGQNGSYDEEFYRTYIWVIKTDSRGRKIDELVMGKIPFVDAYSSGYLVTATTDGNYVVVVHYYNYTHSDPSIYKFDKDLNIIWEKKPKWGQMIVSVIASDDGGLTFVSEDSDSSHSEMIIVKLDRDGNVQWIKEYGGKFYDRSCSISKTDDGGYVVAGGTVSYGNGGLDMWVLKLDSEGNCNGCIFE